MSDKLDMASPDLVNKNIERLAALFPNCVTETADGKAIDFDLLKQELNHEVVDGTKERYRLEWPGKRESIVTANLPTTKTLRPIRNDSKDFDSTENLYIEGDNLEVLKLLQESYLGKIKMIYIDPPYNTGSDFIYKDNFAQNTSDFKEESGLIDEFNHQLVANPETSGRYHSDWLSMMYPRLKLARNLLSDDGVIFISIDDNEVENLKKICDEIFGDTNSAGTIIWQKSKKGDSKLIAKTHEYILAYVRNKNTVIDGGGWKIRKEGVDEVLEKYEEYKKKLVDHQKISKAMSEWFNSLKDSDPKKNHKHYKYSDDRGLYFPDNFAGPDDGRESRPRYDIIHPITGKSCKKPSTGWRWDEKKTLDALKENPPLIHFGEDETTIPCRKSYLKNTSFEPFSSVFYQDGRAGTLEVEKLVGKSIFPFPKDSNVISKLIELVCTTDSIILDFFSGSASTAHATLKFNSRNHTKHKYIMVQLPEILDSKSEGFKQGFKNICDVGRNRIRNASIQIKNELGIDLDYGFRVYQLDDSNMLDVYYHPNEYKQENLELFADNVKSDRTSDDLLTQILLDWGLPLSLKIEQLKILGKQVFKIAENSLVACFDNDIDEAFAKEVADHKPLRIVFRDSSFRNDTAKENVKQLLKQLTPDTEMRVI